MTTAQLVALAAFTDNDLDRTCRILSAKVANNMIGPGTEAALAAVQAELGNRGLPVPVAGSVVTQNSPRWTGGRNSVGRLRMPKMAPVVVTK